MKKHLKFIILAPLFMAVLCEDVSDDCGLEDRETYTVNIENISETYAADETIWINSQISSMLVDFCTSSDDPELITDAQVFRDGLFVLKLNNQPELNAEVVTDVITNYDIGESFTFNVCSQAISILPELNENNLFYQYRLGFSINSPGDYCIVSTLYNAFNLDHENNAQIFETYNTLNNQIKFESCDIIFTRTGSEGHYFFTIQ